jgi:KRAB domain-containing zinc finger protein
MSRTRSGRDLKWIPEEKKGIQSRGQEEEEEEEEEVPSSEADPVQTIKVGTKIRFKCNKCDFTFSRRNGLTLHENKVHSSLRPCSCDECDFTAFYFSELIRHKVAAHDLKPPKATAVADKRPLNVLCDLCAWSTTDKYHLEVHVKAVHLRVKEHKCDQCEYTSAYILAVRNHKKNVHVYNPKDKKCKLCDFTTCHVNSLRGHVLAVHAGCRSHVCDKCNFAAVHAVALRVHNKAAHSGLKDHKCERCSYATTTNQALKVHVKAIHDKVKDKVCEECGYTTFHMQSLLSHMRNNHAGHKTLLVEASKKPKKEQSRCPHENCRYATAYDASMIKHIGKMHL